MRVQECRSKKMVATTSTTWDGSGGRLGVVVGGGWGWLQACSRLAIHWVPCLGASSNRDQVDGGSPRTTGGCLLAWALCWGGRSPWATAGGRKAAARDCDVDQKNNEVRVYVWVRAAV